MQKYYQNEPKFNVVYSRNSLSKIKGEACIINLDEYELIETHWIPLYVNSKNITYFHGLETEHIPKKVRKFAGNKTFITNIHRIQVYDSIMCGYYYTGFIDFMLKGKNLLKYTHLQKEWQNNIEIFKYNLNKLKWWKSIVTFAINIGNLKTLKYHIFFIKAFSLCTVCSMYGHEYKKYLKKNQLKY